MSEAMAASIAAMICKNYGNLCTNGMLNNMAMETPQPLTTTGNQLIIADFGGSSAGEWNAVNDDVMGGNSKGDWKVVNDGVMGGKSQGDWKVVNDGVMGGNSKGDWKVVNDGVMGGVSKGGMSDMGNVMLFEGYLSLENNGGFSSVQVKPDPILDLGEYDGIALRVKGDGRTYKLWLESDARYYYMPISWMAEFATTKDQWTEVMVNFDELEPSHWGKNLSGSGVRFNKSSVEKVGVILADKIQGPFRMEIDWIKAM